MDKYCQNCNQANSADAVFCRNCSAPLAQNQFGGQQQQNQQWNTPNVGNQPNFSAPVGGNAAGGASTRATVALILAIAGFFCCGLPAIAAAIVGWIEVGAIKRGESPQAGMTMAQIGLWGGLVMTILWGIGGILYVILVIAAAGSSNPYGY